MIQSRAESDSVFFCDSFVAWLTSMTRTIATKFGCLPFKTECNVPIHILPTVYVHLRRNQLCLREYSSKRTIQQFCVYFSVHSDAKEYSRTVRRTFCVCMLQCLHSENRTKLSSLLRRQIDPYVCSSLTPTYWFSYVLCAVQQVYYSLCPTGS